MEGNSGPGGQVMATPILGRAATEWTLDDSRFQKGVARVLQTMTRLQARAQVVGRVARNMLLIGGGALAGFVKLASDATETASKFEAVFRDGADAANEFAAALAKSVGRSKIDIQEALSTFQGFFVGLGFATEKARKLSQQLTTLGIDFASFNNLADDEAIGRFISALSGSGEVLDRFGINIKQAALGQKLLEQGIKGGVAKATEQQKAIARLAIIMKAMTDQGAVGDAIRTADQFANRMRALKSVIKDVSVQIGNIFIPALGESSEKLKENTEALGKWVERNQDAIKVNTILVAKLAVLLVLLPKIIALLKIMVAMFFSVSLAARGVAVAFALLIPATIFAVLSRLNQDMERVKRNMRTATLAAQDFNAALREASIARGLGDIPRLLEAKRRALELLKNETSVALAQLLELDRKQQESAARRRREGAQTGGTVLPPGRFERGRAEEIRILESDQKARRRSITSLEIEIRELEAKIAKLAKTARAPGATRTQPGLTPGQFFGPQALFKAIQKQISGTDKDAKALNAAQATSKNTKKSADSNAKQVSQLGAIHDVLRGGIGAVFT